MLWNRGTTFLENLEGFGIAQKIFETKLFYSFALWFNDLYTRRKFYTLLVGFQKNI